MVDYNKHVETELARAAKWYELKIKACVDSKLLYRSTVAARAKEVASTHTKLTRQGKKLNQWTTLSDYLGMRLVTMQGVRADDVVKAIKEVPGIKVGQGDKKHLESGEGIFYTATHYALTCTTRDDADPVVPRPNFEVELQVRDLLEDTLATWTHSAHKAGPAGPQLAHPGEPKHRHTEDEKWIADQRHKTSSNSIDAAVEERAVEEAIKRLQEHLAARSAADQNVDDVDTLDKHMRNIAGLRAAQEANAQIVLTGLIDAHLDSSHMVQCCVTCLELISRFNSESVAGSLLVTINKVMRKYPLDAQVCPRVVTAADRILLFSKWQRDVSAQETLRLLKVFYDASAGKDWAAGPRHLADHVLRRCDFKQNGQAAAAASKHVEPPLAAGAHTRSELQPDASLCANEQLTSPNGLYSFYLQDDGNAVLRRQGQWLWDTKTAADGKARGAYRLHMQLDNNLVVYSDKTALWSSKTANQMQYGAAALYLLDSGDLEVRAGTHVLWKPTYDQKKS